MIAYHGTVACGLDTLKPFANPQIQPLLFLRLAVYLQGAGSHLHLEASLQMDDV